MPFKSIGRGKFRSSSGRIFTAKQVRAYYATKGFRRRPRRTRRGRRRRK